MQRRHQRRRSYGYIKEQTERRNAEIKTRSSKKKTKKRPGRPIWLIILLFPFQLLWFFVKLLWRLWKKRPKVNKETKGLVFKKLFFLSLVGGVFIFLLSVVAFFWISKDLPDPNRLTDRQVAQTTKIYDRTGDVLLYEIFSEQKRTMITLEQIPKDLINAVVATEDKKFYEHRGIRPLSIGRAVVYGIFTNRRIEGTSTLTQQLVKNAILTNERKISRKLKELILSIRLEQKYSKDQILQIYFNEIPYGSTNYGVQAAAQSYFKKDVGELELHELATLAGMPKAPSKYLNNKEALKTRRNFVLRRMFEEGYISKEKKEEAQEKELKMENNVTNIKAPHFVFYVKEQLVEKYGETFVNTGGLKVITSLDWEKQQIAETAVEDVGTAKLEAAEANNTALVAMDPNTGHILAMVGSKDYFDKEIKGEFNVAALGQRQPGSSFKPIIYAAAFEKGYTPETVLFDVVTNFAASGKAYQPLNYDLKEHGPVTMRQAIQGSLNIPAVKTLYLVGSKKGVEFAERLGYSTLSDGGFGLSLVLGGGVVRLIDHVSAYGVFANDGKKVEEVGILRVENDKGDVLEEWKPKRAEQVLDKDVTATISNVLSDDAARAYAFGAGGILTIPGRPVAAKTGTTNDYIDAWTIGYTPSLVAGVWAGNTDNSSMKRGFGGSSVAAPIWNSFMQEALKGTPVEQFPKKPKNTAQKAVLRGSQGGGITLLVDKVTGKLATSSTPEKYIVERVYTQGHSILHYVEKDNPRGEIPTDPNEDPQYTIWERSIIEWITRKQEEDPDWQISFDEPPTDFDDIHSLELIPTLEIVYPTASSTISTRQINTDIRASAPRGITRVIYKIDNKTVDIVSKHPFNLNYTAKRLSGGAHTLTIVVEDDVGNRLEEDVVFIFDESQESPSVYWATGNQNVVQSDFPRTFNLKVNRADQINSVSVYYEKDGERVLLKEFSSISEELSFVWENVQSKGAYVLVAEVEINNNKKGGDRIRVIVK